MQRFALHMRASPYRVNAGRRGAVRRFSEAELMPDCDSRMRRISHVH
jgi:hypothetical protein